MVKFLETLAQAAAFLGLARRQWGAESEVYEDPETGLTFASFTTNRDVTVRIAIPDQIPDDNVFDTVIQILAPKSVGWFGWAWGGHMTYNPLAIAWLNGTSNVVLSPRIAYGYFSPPEHLESSYTVLKAGTFINETHWQVTAKASGVSRWGDEWIGYTDLVTDSETTFAYAWSDWPVDVPEDAASTFMIHQGLGHPVFDLRTAKNEDFDAKVEALLE